MPHRRPHVVAEHQACVTPSPAYLGTGLVGYRTHQQAENQITRAVATGIDGTDDDIAPIECQHVRIGTMIEQHLERVPTMLRDADDQHLVIIAQKVIGASVGNRAPPHGARLAQQRQPRRAERAMDTGEPLFPLGATTTAADPKRDA